jgi:NTE family protein
VRLFRRKPPKIGLALGSGAARGLAHVGVLKALKEASIPVDIVAGTSMGALVGACFAREGEISAVEEIAIHTGWRDIAHLLDPKLGSLRKGLIRGQSIQELLYSIIGDVEFKDLKIPFVAVATDVNAGEEVVIREGSVIEAVRASMSIPGVFVPVTLEGRCLVDGGLTNPIPADVVRHMGAKFIIAVNVLVEPQKSKRVLSLPKGNGIAEVPNIFNTLIQSIYIMEHEIIKSRIPKADIIISPDVSRIEAFEFHKGEETILAGYEAARNVLPKLQRLTEKR